MHELEGFRTFSDSSIWALNRHYYDALGPAAWRPDRIPQQGTSNPSMANAYARVLYGCLRDLAAKGESTEPMWILEIGAGSGRLAFYLLQDLCALVDEGGFECVDFRYVMSDAAMPNTSAGLPARLKK